jgi:hypothetical protein
MAPVVDNTIERILADKDYRGHNTSLDYRVFTGQKRFAPKIKL